MDELLNNQTECVIYFKDTWENDIEVAKNSQLKQIYDALNQNGALITSKVKIDYYPRRKKEECRLALRCSLSNFQQKDLEEVATWFNTVIKEIEKVL